MNTDTRVRQKNDSTINFISLFTAVLIMLVLFSHSNKVHAAERISYSKETVNQQVALDKKSFIDPIRHVGAALLTEDQQQSLNSNVSVSVTGNSLYSISSATVNLIHDDDFDGYFSGISLTFDADVAASSAIVFARLYIRFEHGPWNRYFTTKTFEIFGNSSFDIKTVETFFSTGYPTGIYEIQIELFEATTGLHTVSYGPNENAILDNLFLEDEGYDFHNPEPYPAAGCSFSANSKFDPVLPSLFLISLIYFGRRYKKNKANN